MIKKVTINKINFINIKHIEIKKILKRYGLFVFPSGPGLATINDDKKYLNSLIKSDYVFFDSGYLVFLLFLIKRIKVIKLSGYFFFKEFIKFIKQNNNNNIKIFSVDPNIKFSKNNFNYLKSLGLKRKNIINYVAPKYLNSKIYDKKLLKLIKKNRPDYIIINIGGGVQEILGHYLKKNLDYYNRVICTGAAISFFTGDQAPINSLIDKFFLGWIVRIFFNPKIFFIRYFNALKLVKIIINSKIFVYD